ncbi:hypothetical protein EYF80_005224 [Liparis tanakae]|uniref:Uncharacterized protein n=1 Tax=Liparis tanakae TaxID=230148 RepID=A0A4Z2J3R6_9TELE|nr:hypothetical protein EYF80_005224 [Liparis tanakae]
MSQLGKKMSSGLPFGSFQLRKVVERAYLELHLVSENFQAIVFLFLFPLPLELLRLSLLPPPLQHICPEQDPRGSTANAQDVLLVLVASVALQLLLVGMPRLLQGEQGSGQQLFLVSLKLLSHHSQLRLGEAQPVPHTFVLHLEDQHGTEKAFAHGMGSSAREERARLAVVMTMQGGGINQLSKEVEGLDQGVLQLRRLSRAPLFSASALESVVAKWRRDMQRSLSNLQARNDGGQRGMPAPEQSPVTEEGLLLTICNSSTGRNMEADNTATHILASVKEQLLAGKPELHSVTPFSSKSSTDGLFEASGPTLYECNDSSTLVKA